MLNHEARPQRQRSEMSDKLDADVIIIGAGPVGLVAALDLSARGITSVVV